MFLGVSEFLLYSTDETIRGLSLEQPLGDKDMLTPITGHMLSVAIDFHAGEIYITTIQFTPHLVFIKHFRLMTFKMYTYTI